MDNARQAGLAASTFDEYSMDIATGTGGESSHSEVDNTLRTKKRKLEDAFHSLDNAVRGPTPEQPPPAKRSNITRSLYSSLAKYGIKPKESKPESPPPSLLRSSTAPELGEAGKKTPHLTAILARAASRTKHAFSFKFAPSTPSPLAPGAEYRPSSLQSFLSRLETYKIATWANKPSGLDAVNASRCGWTNVSKDRLKCGLCHGSWVVGGREGLSRDAANTLVGKQRQGLVDNHKEGCPWRTRQCEPNIYCIPLQSPTATVKDLKTNALALDPVVQDVAIRHPLTPNQLSSLKRTVAAYHIPPDGQNKTAAAPAKPDDAMDVDQVANPETEEEKEPSDTAIITSLFGWSIVPTPPVVIPSTAASSLEARMHRNSPALKPKPNPTSTSPTRPVLRNLSKPASRQGTPTPIVRQGTPSPIVRQGTSTPIRSRRSSLSLSARGSPAADERRASTPLFSLPQSLVNKRENTMLHCVLCQRRIGLWAFVSTNKTDAPEDRPTSPPPPDVLSSPISKDAEQAKSPLANPARPKKPLPQRQFDLLKEHRSYCPYVVKSTVVPSLPTFTQPTNNNGTSTDRPTNGLSRSLSSLNNPNAALEGWRAILAVLLRFGMAERQRAEYDVFGRVSIDSTSTNNEEDQTGLGSVKAMVAGVKQRGGRDLLKYVKGLLG